MDVDLHEPPPASPGAAPPRGRIVPCPSGRRQTPGGQRWPLWASLALHVAVAGAAIALQTRPAPVASAPRATDLGILAPERIQEDAPNASPEEELPELLELPPMPVEAPCEDPAFCEPSPAPPEELPAPVEEPISPLAAPTLADVRPRPRPPPTPPAVAVAPAPSVAPAPAALAAPPAPPPSPAATSVGPRRTSPHPARAPDLPMNARLAGLPRGLVVGLILTVEQDGRVTDVRIERSSGAAVFDDAARAWVLAHWRFEAGAQRFRTRVPFRMPRA